MLGAVIQQPALYTRRLLQPRFRFLHDVVMACSRKTGFPEGLYTGDELYAKTAEKRAFVRKLVECVSGRCCKTITPA